MYYTLFSTGYCQKARKQTNHFSITQNFQMGRVCDVLDPNVTVIYVCPIELHGDEIFEYYEGLVGPDMIAKQTLEGWDRVFFVTPEYLDSFGHHHLPLSSLLKYSTKAVKHIKRLVGGRQAYIMPHIPDRDDLDVSNTLGNIHIQTIHVQCFACTNEECNLCRYSIARS